MDAVNGVSAEERVSMEVEKFFQDFAQIQFHFASATESIDPSVVAPEALAALREEFDRLRSRYLLLETKQALFEAIVRENALETTSKEKLLEQQRRAHHARVEVRQVSTAIHRARSQLRELSCTLARSWERFGSKSERLAQRVDKENAEHESSTSRLESVLEANENSRVYGPSAPEVLTMDSEEKCAAVLDNQVKAIEALDAEMHQLHDGVSKLQSALAPTAEDVQRLREQVAELEAVHAEAVTAAKHPFKEHLQWYQSMVQILTSLGGVEVALPSSDAPHVLRFTVDGSMHLTVTHDAACQSIECIEATPECEFPTADIFEYAVETQSLSFVVQELRMRASTWRRRQEHITSVLKTRIASYDDATGSLTVTLDVGAIVKLAVPRDYPSPLSGSVPFVQSLDSISNHSQKTLDAMVEELNQLGVDKLATLLTTIEQRLAKA